MQRSVKSGNKEALALSTEVTKEEKKNLSLYREEVLVQGKDGAYPALRATFTALTDSEKAEVFRLVQELGVLPEQLRQLLENSCRQSVIILIFNKEKTKVVATGQINWVKSFGSPELEMTRLGTFYLTHAVVEEEYRGRHLGKALLAERFAVLKSGFFKKYARQSSSRKLLLGEQKIDDKLVTKRMLLQATERRNLLVVCDLKDKDAHFGRSVEVSRASGLEMTKKAQEVMKPYSQLIVRQDTDNIFINAYTGVPVNNPVRGVATKSRCHDVQSLYFYGDEQLRKKLFEALCRKLEALGAQYNPYLSSYFGVSAEVVWQIMNEYIQSKEYEVYADQPNKGEVHEQFKQKFKGSKKLHLVTIPKFQTYRFAAGFSR